MRNILVTLRALRSFSGGLGLGLMGTACASTPDFEKELATVHSWTATVTLAASERRAEVTTRAFTARLLAAAVASKEASRQSLRAAAHSDTDRARARRALDSLATALHSADGDARTQ